MHKHGPACVLTFRLKESDWADEWAYSIRAIANLSG
jgi:hypothetical protein